MRGVDNAYNAFNGRGVTISQPGCLADQLLTGLGQPPMIHKFRRKENKASALLRMKRKENAGSVNTIGMG